VSPEDHFAAIRQARAEGLTVIGAYHSHPEGNATPSETDLAEAFDDPEFLQVIVGPAQGRFGTAAYRFRDGRFEPVELAIVD
jgi:proteasome lid subunit RPN8/RPN11